MATVYAKKEDTVEGMIRRWKKKVEKEGILNDMAKFEYYLSPMEKKRAKKKEAQKRARILERKLARSQNKNDK